MTTRRRKSRIDSDVCAQSFHRRLVNRPETGAGFAFRAKVRLLIDHLGITEADFAAARACLPPPWQGEGLKTGQVEFSDFNLFRFPFRSSGTKSAP